MIVSKNNFITQIESGDVHANVFVKKWVLLHSGARWKYFSSERFGNRPHKL
jgi:hypothetical protein